MRDISPTPPPTPSTTRRIRRSIPRSRLLFSVILLVLCAAAGISYGVYKSHHPIDEATALANKLSTVIQLPSEAPILATVTDKDNLPGKPFSGQAENGDKILIYLQAKRAILYRPSSGKIIDITSIETVDTFTTAPKQ